MNAIERLRHAADVHLSGLTVQRREQIAADLAAVDALYQAAKPFAALQEWWETPDTRTTPIPQITNQQAAALAAAVRRVEGQATEPKVPWDKRFGA